VDPAFHCIQQADFTQQLHPSLAVEVHHGPQAKPSCTSSGTSRLVADQMPLHNKASLSTPQPSSLGKPSSRRETISQPLSLHPYNPRLYDYLRPQINIVIYVLYCGCLFEQSHGIPHITGDPDEI